MTEWITSALEKCLDLITYGFTNPMPTTNSGPYMITAKDVAGGEIQYATARHTSEEAFRNLLTDKSRPRNGDVLVTKDGTLGRIAVVQREDLCINQSVALLRPNSLVRSDYLKYLLESPMYQKRMLADAGGSTIQHIYITRLAKMEVRIPPFKVQDTILSMLRPLDGKIRNIRHNNDALERVAKLIFKDWFIDFGPTRAKMLGKVPYLAPETWSLFPDLLDNSGKPSEWRLGRLDDLLVLQRGFDLPTDTRTGGAYSVIAASGVNGTHNQFMVKGPGVVTGRSGVLGNVYFIQDDFWPLNTTLWVKEFREASPLFAYFVLKTIDFQAFNAGSAVPSLNRNHVHGLPMVIPHPTVVARFEEVAKPLFRKINSNVAEGGTLTALRDLLLSKLMSGEIRVKDAEKAVDAVM